MKRLNTLDIIALILLIVGGLNWGLVGLFQYDLVAALFGGADSGIARFVYSLVGLSALYVALTAFSPARREAAQRGSEPAFR